MPSYVQTRSSQHLAKLLMAIRAGNVEAFEKILVKEGLPSLRNDADYNLLKKSLVYGRSKIAQILLKRGCRAYKRFDKGSLPLHVAVSKRNSSKLVRRLLDHGARVDQRNRADDTSLHVAFHLAEGKVVDLMLEQHLRNSLANESNAMGMTYLHIAATRKHLDNVRCLVEVGNAFVNCQIHKSADSPYAGFTPLHMAVEFNNLKVAKLLLNNGATLWARDLEESTPIHLALERKNVEMLELFFRYDYKREDYFNKRNVTHFMAACVIGDPTVCEDYLLNPTNSKTAMVSERVDEVFSESTYPFKCYTPLHFAAECGHQEIVELLLNNGAPWQARNSNGLLPKHLASINGYHQAADLFAKHFLRCDWTFAFSSLTINAGERVEEDMACDDNDSGIFYDSDSDSVSIGCDDNDADSMEFTDDDDDDERSELSFWEDDIAGFML